MAFFGRTPYSSFTMEQRGFGLFFLLLINFSLLITSKEYTTADHYGHEDEVLESKQDEPCEAGKRCNIQSECPVTFTPNAQCQKLREVDILRARYWYKLTNNNSTIKFPLAKDIPWLDQTMKNIGYYYALDPDESRYWMLFVTYQQIVEKIPPSFSKVFGKFPFQTNKEYVLLHQAWNKAILALKAPQYFGNPSQQPDFTDHFSNEYWKSDQAFTQRRLAGECPYLLRKVVSKGSKGINIKKLAPLLKKSFFDGHKFKFSKTEELTMKQTLQSGRLFVLYLEDMDSVPTTPDLLAKFNPNLKMKNLTSPITFFILKENGHLEVSAIQTEPYSHSVVLTPESDAEEWQLAKGQVDLTVNAYCQAKIHLGGIHWITTVYCLTYRRHLSTKHPLYEFFLHHCEGTVPHITVSWTTLTELDTAGNLLYSMGRDGFVSLSKKMYDERNYESFTFKGFINDQGLDDERISYYPFRDDAKLLLQEYNSFANNLVNKLYGRFDWYGRSIKEDKELQSWVNELSAHGTILPDGSKGKMVGFPPRFNRKAQLKTFIKRFLWYNVVHTTCNYPLAPDFIPTAPTKLYESTDGSPLTYLQMVPGAANSLRRGAAVLGNFRVNRIFAYYKKVTSPTFRRIVQRYYQRLHKCVQKKMAERNAARKAKGQLGYQYIEPKWLTNSIHI